MSSDAVISENSWCDNKSQHINEYLKYRLINASKEFWWKAIPMWGIYCQVYPQLLSIRGQ